MRWKVGVGVEACKRGKKKKGNNKKKKKKKKKKRGSREAIFFSTREDHEGLFCTRVSGAKAVRI